jgi:predicted metal-dependent enzyme (double-stranded beta helix superfamily)
VLDKVKRSNITPFPGNPDARVSALSGELRYGLQEGTTPLMAEFVQTLQNAIDQCQGPGTAAAAKAALRGYVCDEQLLAPIHKQGSEDNYTRHLLYASPEGSCTVLALVWYPGQVTPIHGHTAWGAVGVYEGSPFCENYDTAPNENGAIQLRSKMKLCLHSGDLATVRPGIDDVHRIGNNTQRRAITVHVYGRDLVAEPTSLNIVFNP